MRKGLGGDAPEIRILTSPPGAEDAQSLPLKERRFVPKTAIDNKPTLEPLRRVQAKIHDYSNDTVNTRGVGRRRSVQQTIGKAETVDSEWVDFEQANPVNARWVFRREISRRYRPALFMMHTTEAKLDAKIGLGSPAYESLTDAAAEAIDEYLRHAVIKQLKPRSAYDR